MALSGRPVCLPDNANDISKERYHLKRKNRDVEQQPGPHCKHTQNTECRKEFFETADSGNGGLETAASLFRQIRTRTKKNTPHPRDNSVYFHTFAEQKKQSAGLSLMPFGRRGKSGQRRASYFLTESRPRGRSNAEENNRLPPAGGKGEKVGQEPTSRAAMYGLCILGVVRSCKPAPTRVARPTSEGRPLESGGDARRR